MNTTKYPRVNALWVYLLLEGASALLFNLIVTIYVVYYATTVGLDPLQIVLVGTTFEATIFLFEIPTGVIADAYSRRVSIIAGVFLTGIGLLTEGLFPTFGAILIAEVVAGIGATLMSGATEAWISDEIGEAQAAQAFIRAAQVRNLAGIAGIILSVVLASVQLNLPFVAAGALFVLLAGLLLLVMPERGFKRRSEQRTDLLVTARAGFRLVRVRPALLVILGVAFVYAFHSEGFEMLWQKHILDHFTLPALAGLDSVAWFGIIGLGANVLSIAVSEIVRRRADLNNHHTIAHTLMILYALMAAGIIGFALAGDFALAVGLFWLVMALQTAAKPVGQAWLNQHAHPEIRATLFSMSGQVGSVGEMLGGLPVGLLGRWFSLRAALAFSGIILALTLLLLNRVQQREVQQAVEIP